jgi:two-component system NtrC family sensor kinase
MGKSALHFTKNLTLTKKFLLGVGVIVIVFWALFSYLVYIYLKEINKTDAFNQSNLLFEQIQSTRRYVREDLRPLMYHVLPENHFIKEAMSVSFITKSIMNDFGEKHPDVIYRRVALDPLNPENAANDRERGFIALFEKDRERSVWKGVLEIDQMKYAIHAKPVIIEEGCLSCHGSPESAPADLIKAYGTSHGFNKKAGDIIGIEYLALPLDKTFSQISDLVMTIFIAGIIGMVLMFTAINSLINLVAVRPLGKVRSFFRSVVKGDKGLDSKFAVRSGDEIGELAHSFNRMMEYLRSFQEKLSSSEKKYRKIFEGSKDAILVADYHGIIQEINSAGIDLFGYTHSDIVLHELSVQDIFHNKEDYSSFLSSLETDGFVKDHETKLRTVNGSVKDILISANYREDDNNEVCGFEAIIKDITERKKLFQQVNEAERLAAIGQLASGVAHEINNPLSIILGYTGLLLDDKSVNGQFREDLETIYANANVCKRIVEDLLNFSRKSKTEFAYHSINDIIDSVVEMLHYKFQEKNITVQKNYSTDLPLLLVDDDKIKQVCMNILINSFQAVGDHGIIEISTSLNEADSSANICVQDNGSGIDDAIIDKIFQPFFSTKPIGEGTGLGLSVSYGIIREHNGVIKAESNGPNGASFTIELPIILDRASRELT